MTFDIDSAARRVAGVAFIAVAFALTACGGGDEASPAMTTVASAEVTTTTTTAALFDSGAGVVAADQLPSVMSTMAGLPSDQDLGLAPSQSQSL